MSGLQGFRVGNMPAHQSKLQAATVRGVRCECLMLVSSNEEDQRTETPNATWPSTPRFAYPPAKRCLFPAPPCHTRPRPRQHLRAEACCQTAGAAAACCAAADTRPAASSGCCCSTLPGPRHPPILQRCWCCRRRRLTHALLQRGLQGAHASLGGGSAGCRGKTSWAAWGARHPGAGTARQTGLHASASCAAAAPLCGLITIWEAASSREQAAMVTRMPHGWAGDACSSIAVPACLASTHAPVCIKNATSPSCRLCLQGNLAGAHLRLARAMLPTSTESH